MSIVWPCQQGTVPKCPWQRVLKLILPNNKVFRAFKYWLSHHQSATAACNRMPRNTANVLNYTVPEEDRDGTLLLRISIRSSHPSQSTYHLWGVLSYQLKPFGPFPFITISEISIDLHTLHNPQNRRMNYLQIIKARCVQSFCIVEGKFCCMSPFPRPTEVAIPSEQLGMHCLHY